MNAETLLKRTLIFEKIKQGVINSEISSIVFQVISNDIQNAFQESFHKQIA